MIHPPLRIKWKDGSLVTVAEAARRIGITQCGLWHRLEIGVPRDQLFLPGTGSRAARVAQILKDGSPFIGAISGEMTPEEYLENDTGPKKR